MITEKEQISDLSSFIKFLRHYYKTLLFYFLAGALLSFVLTLFIPKEYKSYGIVYPPSSTSLENSIDFPNFGYDLEADRLIQILESRDIRDSVIQKFDLVSYFEIQKDNPAWLDDLVKKYYKNIKFERSSSMAVLISARTKDPELSANIVNYILHLADAQREKIYKTNIVGPYENAKSDYELQKIKVDSAEVILIEQLKNSQLSSLLLLMSDAQISIDIDKLGTAGISGERADIGQQLIAFKSMYELMKEYKSRYLKIKKTYDNAIPKLFVINYAEVNHKKISPSFPVNILIGSLFSLFAAVVVLLVRHTHASN